VRVERELPFMRREEDALMEGAIDRLVLILEGGRTVAAEVLDYKTDDLAAGDAAALAQRVAHYRPQMDAYRRAVAEMYGLPAAAVRGCLAFVACTEVVEVD
jgi:ATP-dependent exoDNAse (exonuclease V) beta subunit